MVTRYRQRLLPDTTATHYNWCIIQDTRLWIVEVKAVRLRHEKEPTQLFMALFFSLPALIALI